MTIRTLSIQQKSTFIMKMNQVLV